MNQFLHKALTVIFLSSFFSHSTSSASTYYLDSSNGSNAYDGLSEASAWKDFENINDDVLEPGDSVLLKRGNEWEGVTMSLTASGTEAAPIVFDNYGSDLEKAPVVRGASGLNNETLVNADFDLLDYVSAENAEKPISWAINPGDTANHIKLVEEPLAYKGKSVELYYASGSASRIWRSISNVAYGELVKFTVRANVVNGLLQVRLRNPTTCNYYNPVTSAWENTSPRPNIHEVTQTSGWQLLTFTITNDVAENSSCGTTPSSVSQVETSYYVSKGADTTGLVYLDDFEFAGAWRNVGGNIYQRLMLTSNSKAITGMYIDDELQSKKIRSSDLTKNGDWYWEAGQTYCEETVAGSQRYPFLSLSGATCKSGYTLQPTLPMTHTLYFYWDGDIASLKNANIKADRTNYILIDVRGEHYQFKNLLLEKAQRGYQLSKSNVSIEDNTVRYMDQYSILVYGTGGVNDVSNISIINNLIHDSGNGPYLFRGAYSYLGGNHIYNIDKRGTFADNEALPIQAGHDIIFENNVIHDSYIGIDLWGRRNEPDATFNAEAYNNIVRFNTIFNIDTYGVVIGGETRRVDLLSDPVGQDCPVSSNDCVWRAHVYNNQVHNNVIFNSGYLTDRGAGIRHIKTAFPQPNYIFNNTLYKNRVSFNGESFAGNFVYRNNISVAPKVSHLDFPGATFVYGDLEASQLSNNIYFPGAMPVVDEFGAEKLLFIWNDSYTIFAPYSLVSGKDIMGSFSEDPLLSNVLANDFSLASGSPAIDGAIGAIAENNQDVVLSAVDIVGTGIATGTNPDIGAYEAKDSDSDKIADVNDVEPNNVFLPNMNGWNLSRDSGFATEDGVFRLGDTLYLRVWDILIDPAKYQEQKSNYRILSAGVVVHEGIPTYDSQMNGYTAAVPLLANGAGDYTLEFTIKEKGKYNFSMSGLPFKVE